MLTIYGVYHSRASRNIWLANELGLAFRHVPVIQAGRAGKTDGPDAPVHTKSAAFLAINPSGQIPSIDDDGLILHQSLAINLYLAKKHGGPLAAADPAEQALIDMWTLWAATDVEPHALQVLLYNDGNPPASRDPAAVAEAVEILRRPFAMLDAHLQREGHLVGKRFTVADINAAEVIRYAMTATALFDAHPHIKAWLTSCHARPAFIAMYEKRLAETV